MLAVLAAGCVRADTGPAAAPGEALSPAQRQLAELAGLAAAAEYDVTYDLAATTGDRGTIRIVAAPPSYRVDVALGGEPSTFIERAGTVVSCTRKAGRAACVLVARPGEPVPPLFDPGVQRLFTEAVADLAANPERYDVTAAASGRPAPAPPATCFDVRRIGSTASPSAVAADQTDPTGFETGQYCFGADGVLTRLAVSTGTLTQRSRGPAPSADAFDPPATPVALPDLPTASPTG